MCGHEFMFHTRDDLQRHRPRWQCGTCGRVSFVPLDCCTRPDVAQHRPAGLTHLLSQWISTCGRWTLPVDVWCGVGSAALPPGLARPRLLRARTTLSQGV